jgi:hypothetical protein
MKQNLAVVMVVALACGCLTSQAPSTTTLADGATAENQQTPSTTTTVAMEATSTTTMHVAEVDDRTLCLEARASRITYERCKMAGSGDLSLPQSELRICAQIQQNAGAYSEAIFHGLQHCTGIPEGGVDSSEYAMLCKDLGQPDRDQCYLSASMCDPIENSDIKNQCQSGLQINKL